VRTGEHRDVGLRPEILPLGAAVDSGKPIVIRKSLLALVLVSSAATGVASRAHAADVLVEPAPVWSWSGCYVGANVGYVHGDDDALDAPFTEGPFAGTGVSWNTPPGAPYETIGSDASSAIGGGEVGCDYAVPMGGVEIVIGAAADISVLGLSGEGTSAISSDTHTSFDVDWAASFRARLGVAPAPELLIYATGGYAAAGVDVRAFDLATAPSLGTMDVSGGGTESGWVVGGGGEWRFAENWSVSAEYLHFDFDDIVATGAATFPPGAFPRFENDVTFDTVRIGVKFRM
jgi:outer membrane immunogenic protein